MSGARIAAVPNRAFIDADGATRITRPPPARDDSTSEESSHGPIRCASAATTTPVRALCGERSHKAVVSMPVTDSNEAAAGRPVCRCSR